MKNKITKSRYSSSRKHEFVVPYNTHWLIIGTMYSDSTQTYKIENSKGCQHKHSFTHLPSLPHTIKFKTVAFSTIDLAT